MTEKTKIHRVALTMEAVFYDEDGRELARDSRSSDAMSPHAVYHLTFADNYVITLVKTPMRFR